MCVVSMIGDHYSDKFRNPQRWPGIQPFIQPQTVTYTIPAIISREEFDALKREVEEMKSLLVRAKIYDEKNGEPDCEMDEKVEILKKVAALVGIDLDKVFGGPGSNEPAEAGQAEVRA